MFSNENDVRKFIRKIFQNIYFIEYSSGGNRGLPDCFFMNNGRTFFIELKCVNNLVKYDEMRNILRKSQLNFIEKCYLENVPILVISGIKGTKLVSIHYGVGFFLENYPIPLLNECQLLEMIDIYIRFRF